MHGTSMQDGFTTRLSLRQLHSSIAMQGTRTCRKHPPHSYPFAIHLTLQTQDDGQWPSMAKWTMPKTPTQRQMQSACPTLSVTLQPLVRSLRILKRRQTSAAHSEKGNYLCDVCWRCWPTNYGRFISQVRPVETSVGWWQQGPRDQAYGRFARGLHHATNRTKITMHLEKGLSIVNAKVSIVFLDRGRGKWSLGVNGKAVLTETLTHTERWRTLTTASLAHIKAGDELTLWSPDNTDVIFSLLEIYARRWAEEDRTRLYIFFVNKGFWSLSNLSLPTHLASAPVACHIPPTFFMGEMATVPLLVVSFVFSRRRMSGGRSTDGCALPASVCCWHTKVQLLQYRMHAEPALVQFIGIFCKAA